ncbi:NmrA family transcriptional regulator [Frankia sp. CcI49]|nr:NmrA family transcriptional regulator [Frankia sp. CcI49]
MVGGGRDVVLVTGATGNQGGAVATRLLADGWSVRALTRDPTGAAARRLADRGAEIVVGDLADPQSLDVAAKGVHGVFSVQRGALGYPPVPFADEVAWGRNVADAAARAGVRHVVHASAAGVGPAAPRALASKWEIEEYLRGSGLPVTILRPVSFMENYASPAFGVHTGTLASPFAPDVAEQLIALDDIGAFVALAFADPARFAERTLAIAGDELRPAETARALSRATGRDIGHVQLPVDVVRAANEDFADAVAFVNERGGYGADLATARALHPELMTFETWLDRRGAALVAALFD